VREWKEGDKVVYELSTGTVGPGGEFHGGGGITSGNLAPRFRESRSSSRGSTKSFIISRATPASTTPPFTVTFLTWRELR
jgi:hypothetical protein